MRLVGIGYRPQLAHWLSAYPPEVELIELTAEHFFDDFPQDVASLIKHYPTVLHGLGLSLGTPGPLDRKALISFSKVVEKSNPIWISEHIAFTRTNSTDFGHLNPIPYTKHFADTIVDHAKELMDRFGRRLILENITTNLIMPSTMSETDFISDICRRSGCGLLLDVTNLFINAHNRSFDPWAWVERVDPSLVTQLHVVGYSKSEGVFEDCHRESIQEDLMDFTAAVLSYAKGVEGVIIERDANFPVSEAIASELWRLKYGQ